MGLEKHKYLMLDVNEELSALLINTQRADDG
jgi:hypothetical protein